MYITQRKKEKILKIIHITSYVFNGLFLLLLLIGLCGCSSSNNNDDLHKQRTTNTIQRKLYSKEDTEEWNGIENFCYRDSNYFYFYTGFINTTDFIENFAIALGGDLSVNGANGIVSKSISGYGYFWLQSSDPQHALTLNNVTLQHYSNDSICWYNISCSSSYTINIYFFYSNNLPSGVSVSKSTTQYPRFTYLKIPLSYNSLFTDTFNTYIDSLAPSSGGGSSGESVSNAEQNNLIDLTSNYNPLFIYSSSVYQNGLLAIMNQNYLGNDAITLTGLSFKSNNLIFDTIKIQYKTTDGVNFSFDNGSTILDVTNYDIYDGYGFFLNMMYINSVDNTSINVLQTSQNINNTKTYFNLSQKFWTNNEYQKIEIINDDETIMRQNMTTKQLLQIQGSITDSIIGGYSPFTLFSSAFTSISNILNIAILPGITIGLLLFMPLLVVIITLIFKLVKK